MTYKSTYLCAVDQQAQAHPQRTAFITSDGESLTYEELCRSSNALACWLADESNVEAGAPVVLYGHKSPYMLVGMLACAKSGHAYAPIDTIFPRGRVPTITDQLVEQAGSTLIINTTDADFAQDGASVLPLDRLRQICQGEAAQTAKLDGLDAEDTFYLLFTSGSTGVPKGVEVPTRYVDYFSRWLINDYRMMATQKEREDGLVWFNRSPFTFDLSTDDLFCGLATGDCVFALTEEAESSFKATFEALSSSGITDWISTPSFVDSCLVDPSFSSELIPSLRRVMLAGETLRKDTVAKLKQRFPGVRVLNNYGPTETGTVTICEITEQMMDDERPLPIGYLGPEVEAAVLDHDTLEPVPNGTPGELFIVGNVGKGYWGRPDLTAAGFASCPASVTEGRSSYRTGDECILEDNGLVYYNGRLDGMLKLHGYRIEIGEIESVLASLEQVDMACVLPERKDDGTVHRLIAVIKPSQGQELRGLKLTRLIKNQVRDTLPSYMIPNVFKYVETVPLNPNGKADRKALAALIGA